MARCFALSSVDLKACTTFDDGLEEGSFTFAEYADTVCKAGAGSGIPKTLDGLVHGLVGEPEGSVVHGDHSARGEIAKGLECIFRAGMHVAEAVRIIGADGQQRDLR